MRKIICVILTLIFVFLMTFAGYQILREYSERQESAGSYEALEEFISFPDVSPSEENDETILSESGENETVPVGPTVDFAELSAINDDCVAWIYIEGTTINYPIVQGDDNSYYLKYLFDKTWNSSGCIFLDCRVAGNFSDKHSIIYGHHMKSNTMFHGLMDYKKQEFYDQYPTGMLITPAGNYQIEFFAGYAASVDDSAWKIGFESDEDFEMWIKEIKERSWFESTLSPAVTDRIQTLSTCSYEFDNARFVLHGIMIEY